MESYRHNENKYLTKLIKLAKSEVEGYIRLTCLDCGYSDLFPGKTSDGRCCPVCGGKLFIPTNKELNTGIYDEMHNVYLHQSLQHNSKTANG